MIEATNNLKSSLTSMISDVAKFTEFTGRSIGEMFTDVAGQRLEYQMSQLFDNIFAGIEADLGAAILGVSGGEVVQTLMFLMHAKVSWKLLKGAVYDE